MIDIESDVFDIVTKALKTQYPNLKVSGEYESVADTLPAVTISQEDNRIVEDMRTTHIENAVSVMFQVDVYSNKVAVRKTEAKAIMAVVDDSFSELGFTRTFLEPTPNFNDSRIFRLTARYEAIVGDGAETGTYLIYHN